MQPKNFNVLNDFCKDIIEALVKDGAIRRITDGVNKAYCMLVQTLSIIGIVIEDAVAFDKKRKEEIDDGVFDRL